MILDQHYNFIIYMSEQYSISSEVARTVTLDDQGKATNVPELVKGAPVDWQKVKNLDNNLDNLPIIVARKAEIAPKQFFSPDELRQDTKMKLKGEENNLYDYASHPDQIKTMLQEGLRLGVINQADFEERGIHAYIFRQGANEPIKLNLPELNKLQKADLITLLLLKVDKSNAETGNLFLDRLSSLIIDPKKVVSMHGGEGEKGASFSNLDLLDVLTTAGREELSNYLLEQGYQPHSFPVGETDAQRRVVAKLVQMARGEPYKRVLSGETPYFVDKKHYNETTQEVETTRVPEYSAKIDLLAAQGAYNVLLPENYFVNLANLEAQALAETDPAVRADLRQTIVEERQIAYAALLSVFGAKGYERDGEVFGDFSHENQARILKMSEQIKKDRLYNESLNLTMYDANRRSLAKISAKILGQGNKGILTALSDAIPMHTRLTELEEKYRGKNMSERMIRSLARQQLAQEYVDAAIALTKPARQMNQETFNEPQTKELATGVVESLAQPKQRLVTEQDKALLKTFFLRTFDTEMKLTDTAHLRLEDKDDPRKLRYGTTQALDHAVKGLDLLFRRTVTPDNPNYSSWQEYLQKMSDFRQTEPTEEKPSVGGAEVKQGQQQEANEKAAEEEAKKQAAEQKTQEDAQAEAEQQAAEQKAQEDAQAEADKLAAEEAAKKEAEAKQKRSEAAKRAAETRRLKQEEELNAALELAKTPLARVETLIEKLGGLDRAIAKGRIGSADLEQAMAEILPRPLGIKFFQKLTSKENLLRRLEKQEPEKFALYQQFSTALEALKKQEQEDEEEESA